MAKSTHPNMVVKSYYDIACIGHMCLAMGITVTIKAPKIQIWLSTFNASLKGENQITVHD